MVPGSGSGSGHYNYPSRAGTCFNSFVLIWGAKKTFDDLALPGHVSMACLSHSSTFDHQLELKLEPVR